MSKSWKEFGRSKEEEYFQARNNEALQRLRERGAKQPRLSPLTGEPMEQITYLGVVVDRCPASGGIWLDAGELDQIIQTARKEEEAGEPDWVEYFFRFVSGQQQS